MARVDVPVQEVAAYAEADLDVAFTAADETDNHEFTNDGQTHLIINNASIAAREVTITSNATLKTYNETITKTYTVAAGKIAILNTLDPDIFNTSGGKVEFDIDVETDTSFACVKFIKTPTA